MKSIKQLKSSFLLFFTFISILVLIFVKEFQKQKPDYENVNFDYKSNQYLFDGDLDIHVFVDFEDKRSKKIFDFLIEINKKNPNKIRINIYHYPMDISCNTLSKNDTTKFSCTAALMSICSEDNELDVLSYLFKSQEYFSDMFFHDFIKSKKVSFDCFNDADVKEYIVSSIELANSVGVTDSASLIINNKKYSSDALNYDKLYEIIKENIKPKPNR